MSYFDKRPEGWRKLALHMVLLLSAAAVQQAAQAACSPYLGKVVVNEVRVDTAGGVAAFVELKVLDPSVVSATNNFSGWKLAAYRGSNGNKGEVDVSSAFANVGVNSCGQNSPWIRIPDSSLGNKLADASLLNLVLFDTSRGGEIVDIMRLGSGSGSSYYDAGAVYTACSAIEDVLPATIAANSKYDARNVSGSSVKDYYRAPDGLGDWGGKITSGQGETSCSSNDSGSAFGLSKVTSVESVPTNTDFSFKLYAQNGGTGSALSGVQVVDDLNTAGLSFVSCTTASDSCTHSGGVVTWSVGAVAANTTKTASLTVRAATAGAKSNTITSNVGTPTASASAKVQVYAPLADWRMDESSWAGTAGEVKDSSGNGYHGRAKVAAGATPVPNTALGSPAFTSGSQNTCNYGDFDRATGPTRTHSYVELSGIPVLPSSFTFAAWIRSTNATAQHQRILVRDDADNGWGLSLADGTGQGKLRFFNRNITNSGTVSGQGSNPGSGVFALDTDAVITSNNWFFIAASINTTGKVITLYVYNAAGTLLATTSSPFAGTWKDGTGLASIGGESSASSEGRQTSWHFLGNIDELQIYSGVLSQPDLNLLRTRSRNCPVSGLDHIELVHNGAGLTCSPKAVTVLGCTTGASCNGVSSNQYSGGNLILTPTAIAGAQWCSDAVCASPITGAVTVTSGTTLYLREPTARTDTLAAVASGVTNTVVQCMNTTSGGFNATSACNVAFSNAGFLLNAQNHTACTPQTVTLQAVQSSATGETCVPAFQNVNRNVSLYSGYTNPTTGTQKASFNYLTTANATASVSALSTLPGSPTGLTGLYFDNNGTATLSAFAYLDVGQVTLYPSYTGSASTGDAGLSLGAVSGNVFVAAPASFDVVPSGPYVAGLPFAARVTAKNACSTPTVTPNFGKENTAETVVLKSVTASVASAANSRLVGPVGGQFGVLTLGSFSLGACSPASAGSVCDAGLAWTEVGDLALSAVNSNYLGTLLTSWGSGPAGPFRPAYFKTELETAPSCGTFTYSGQPFRVKVTALSAANAAMGTSLATTQNYTLSYAKTVTLGADSAGACTPDVTGFANNTLAATSFTTTPGSARTSPVTNLVSPLPVSFTQTPIAPPSSVTVCAADTDGVTSHGQSQANLSIRNGRARMFNAYGSELLDLPVVFRTEYLSALPNDWRVNTADTCTGATLVFTAVGGITIPTCAWDDPASPASGGNACPAAPTVANRKYLESGVTGTDSSGVAGFAGNFNLWLKAPGTGHTGAIDVTANVPAWLQGPGGNPKARATFGVYKSPLIYRRENY